jgi:hypothetical protein
MSMLLPYLHSSSWLCGRFQALLPQLCYHMVEIKHGVHDRTSLIELILERFTLLAISKGASKDIILYLDHTVDHAQLQNLLVTTVTDSSFLAHVTIMWSLKDPSH